jgi:hypothetical protein
MILLRPIPAGRGKVAAQLKDLRNAIQANTIRKVPGFMVKRSSTNTSLVAAPSVSKASGGGEAVWL